MSNDVKPDAEPKATAPKVDPVAALPDAPPIPVKGVYRTPSGNVIEHY